MIAYCGLDCEGCPIHLATLVQDRGEQMAMRNEIARQCSRYYGIDMRPQDVTDCDGCRSDTGRIFSGCLDCHIRKCATGRKLGSCAVCSDYACEPLRNHFKTDPTSRTRLEALRRTGGGAAHA